LQKRKGPKGLAVAVTVAVVGAGVAALMAISWRPGPQADHDTGPEPPPSPPAVAQAEPPAPPPAAAQAEPPRPNAPTPPPATEARPAALRKALPAQAIAQLNEAVLMARLREVATSDPGVAVQLAREGNRRFPDSPEAPERESILIHALSSLDRPSEARGQAEAMVNHYPDSAWVREIEAFTGAHRHRNLHFNDAGQIVAE
jgi:type IV secretory pathway VirB10-like protein